MTTSLGVCKEEEAAVPQGGSVLITVAVRNAGTVPGNVRIAIFVVAAGVLSDTSDYWLADYSNWINETHSYYGDESTYHIFYRDFPWTLQPGETRSIVQPVNTYISDLGKYYEAGWYDVAVAAELFDENWEPYWAGDRLVGDSVMCRNAVRITL